MATKTGKSEKSQKASNKATSELDDDLELDEATETATEAAVASVNAEEASSEYVAPAEVARAEEDLVTIAMFTEVDPAPTIGHPGHGGYSFSQNGILKLEARKSYTVPRNVADVLIDKKLAGRIN